MSKQGVLKTKGTVQDGGPATNNSGTVTEVTSDGTVWVAGTDYHFKNEDVANIQARDPLPARLLPNVTFETKTDDRGNIYATNVQLYTLA